MSLAITIGDSRLSGYYDYEPVSDVSKDMSRKWAQERNYLKGSASDWLPTVDAAFRSIRDECEKRAGTARRVAITDQVIAIAEKVVRALFTLFQRGHRHPISYRKLMGKFVSTGSVDTEQAVVHKRWRARQNQFRRSVWQGRRDSWLATC